MTHSWCRDIPRDEAVRAAEDGRQGPLPTLEEAISGVTDRRPVDAGGGGNVTGLRTELVTLEVTHDLDAPLGDWIVQVIDESLGFDESVRVVDNTAERITQALTADRFASAVAEADRLKARVAELESAPAASEWRMLKVGEEVKAGDEMTDDMFMPWRDAGPCVGQEAPRGPIAFRRRVTAPAASNSSAILTSSPAASGAAGTEVVA